MNTTKKLRDTLDQAHHDLHKLLDAHEKEVDPETGTSWESKYYVCKAMLEDALRAVAKLNTEKEERDQAAMEKNR